jgi:hypothetical protein
MNHRRRAVGAALLGAVLQVTASVAVAAEVVVCRAPGGHVEIESFLDGDCCPPGEGSYRVLELRDDACDGCLDTLLLRAGLSAPTKAAFDALVPARWLPAPTPRRVSGGAPPLTTAAAGRARTVVLLI